jgi:translation initiation factor IF-2
MSKIRIYELAKELGVDNKAVIAKAVELGMGGKASHSSSLEPEEADQIRRSVIRAAVGREANPSREASGPRQTEVVTTRVDRATGTTQAVVERRSGNVIRRRKATDLPAAEASSENGHEALAYEDGTVSAVGVRPSEDFAESQGEAPPVNASLESRFQRELAAEGESQAIESGEVVADEVAAPSDEGAVVTSADSGASESRAFDDAASSGPAVEGGAVAAAPAPSSAPSAASVARPGPRVLGRLDPALSAKPAPRPGPSAQGQGMVSRTTVGGTRAVPPGVQPSRQIGGHGFVAATQRSTTVPTGIFVSDEPKKNVGPKVLGKIDLPAARPAASQLRQDTAKTFTVRAVTDVREEEEDGDRRKAGGAKKKGRKREIDRFDLIDYEGREPRRTGSKSAAKRRGTSDMQSDAQGGGDSAKTKQSKRVVKIDEQITVGELGRQMSLKAAEIIAKLMELGVMATINQSIDVDTATIIAEEFGFQIERTNFVESDILVDSSPEDQALVQPRPPVVTVMGHVDHGKTSLLDTIRETTVASREHGGITQHIGAYQVQVGTRGAVTFIDTPGHAAFTSMRARGAKVTDIVILVVAADDGAMPQTIEAISHAKAAQVPIIVAVNKMDKPDANPDRIKQQLAEHGLNPEDWGGDTMYYKVSALKKQGIAELLEGILLQAEVKELRANPTRRARGTVIESRQDKGRGTVATVLVQNGTLRVGDVFVAGAEYGRVRSMSSDIGVKTELAGPSTPVEITGFTGVPDAGDDFFVVETESKAKEVAEQRSAKKQVKEQRLGGGPISLEEFARRANSAEVAELNVILKADVHGSLEALREAIQNLSTPKVKVRVLHSGVGGITESDVQLAIASSAVVVGFGVRAETRAQAEAESLGVDLRFYRVIYELLDDVKKAMAGLLAPVRQEVRTGRVEVRETFNVPKMGTVAGCYVLDGVVKRASFVRLLRDSKVVFEGKMGSLRRFKDDVKEVQGGYECGVMLENYNDVKPGDQFEVFDIKEIAASID